VYAAVAGAVVAGHRENRNLTPGKRAFVKKSPLDTLHRQLGARMVEFAGWEMPLVYTGIIDEHRHTRTQCGVFDVSHMGRIRVGGEDAEALLEYVCTRDLSGMSPGVSRYSHICRDDGGILDDVIVSRFEDAFGVVCNAANHDKILAWLHRHAAERKVTIADDTDQTAMIAIQGPAAVGRVQDLLGVELSDLKRYHFTRQVFMTFGCYVYRSGYTGEDGVEIILPVNLVKLALPALTQLLVSDDDVVRPAGLGARDTLRLEAGMPLYGHELTEDWDSLTASQQWCVALDKKDFVGAAAMRALRDEGLKRRVVGLELAGRRTARQGFAIVRADDTVGMVTSGALSPTLGASIAMGLVATECSEAGTPLGIRIGDKVVDAVVVKLPFYRRGRT